MISDPPSGVHFHVLAPVSTITSVSEVFPSPLKSKVTVLTVSPNAPLFVPSDHPEDTGAISVTFEKTSV